MKTKIAISILILAACLLTQTTLSETLKIYLHRQVNIDGDTIRLGDITTMFGDKEDTAVASAINLGKFSVPGQQIIINRRVIQSRLTANKINVKKVAFTGASVIKVGRREIVISPNAITAEADKFLKENNPNASVASYELTRGPQKIVLPAQGAEVTLVPRISSKVSASQTTIDVDVIVNGVKVGTDKVIYKPMYNCRRIVAIKDISAGAFMSPHDIKVEIYQSKYPEQKGWQSPVGLIAKRNIKVGQQIRNSILMKAKAEVLIKRKSLVAIKIQTSTITITANGEAMTDAAVGDTIRVKNIDSKRVIICKVNADGTVSPVM